MIEELDIAAVSSFQWMTFGVAVLGVAIATMALGLHAWANFRDARRYRTKLSPEILRIEFKRVGKFRSAFVFLQVRNHAVTATQMVSVEVYFDGEKASPEHGMRHLWEGELPLDVPAGSAVSGYTRAIIGEMDDGKRLHRCTVVVEDTRGYRSRARSRVKQGSAPSA